ncbi:MAG: hypothetical protein ACPIOQ_50990, partial [Promethearchaeia archaeon]
MPSRWSPIPSGLEELPLLLDRRTMMARSGVPQTRPTRRFVGHARGRSGSAMGDRAGVKAVLARGLPALKPSTQTSSSETEPL